MDTQPARLLLVEDEPDLRDALTEYFEACHFQVTGVSTAAEALEAAQKETPHILLSDLSLPDQRGDLFLQEFHGVHPRCLLYIHSGDSSFLPSAELQDCGLTLDHVFCKPADLAQLVRKLRTDLVR